MRGLCWAEKYHLDAFDDDGGKIVLLLGAARVGDNGFVERFGDCFGRLRAVRANYLFETG